MNDDPRVVIPGKDEGGAEPGINDALALLCSLHVDDAMNNREVAVRVTTKQARNRLKVVV